MFCSWSYVLYPCTVVTVNPAREFCSRVLYHCTFCSWEFEPLVDVLLNSSFHHTYLLIFLPFLPSVGLIITRVGRFINFCYNICWNAVFIADIIVNGCLLVWLSETQTNAVVLTWGHDPYRGCLEFWVPHKGWQSKKEFIICDIDVSIWSTYQSYLSLVVAQWNKIKINFFKHLNTKSCIIFYLRGWQYQ